MNRSIALTIFLLVSSLALVTWWTWFQVGEAKRLERAGQQMLAGNIDGAAQELGAENAANLPDLGRSRRRMFLSEGLVFIGIVIAAGAYLLLAMRRQTQLQQDHDRFLAGATHELKTPLATIQLLLESLRDDRVPADKRDRYLRLGLNEAARLESGLTNVLTAAGLRSDTRHQRTAVDGNLAKDVEFAIAALQPRAEAAGIELDVPELPTIWTSREPEGLQLVLHNLLDNAIKYSNRGDTVRLSLAEEGKEAVFTVSDQGEGMDAQALTHAFRPFWRGRDHHNPDPTSGKKGTGGIGLGLHLCREILRSFGGSITAASQGAGQGSAFTVRLPRQEPPAGDHS